MAKPSLRRLLGSWRPIFSALAVTIALFTAASVAVVLTNDRAGAQAGRAGALSSMYDELQVALLQEELARHHLSLDGGSSSPVVAAQQTATAVLDRIAHAESHASGQHVDEVDTLQQDLAAYHATLSRLITAARAGALLENHEQATDRQAQQLIEHVADESHHHRTEATEAFDRMRRAQALGAQLFPILGVAALLLAGGFLRLMALQRRRLSALRTEAQVSAVTDELTGLANRAGLRQAVGRALPAAAPDRRLALLLLDLDGFKAVNDTFGHELGDEVLKVVAERLRRAVPDSAFIARLGGDEFVVLLPAVADQAEVERVAGEIWAALSAPTIVRSVLADVGASIGMAVTDGDSGRDQTAASELLRHADIAMYASKKAKRGPVLFSALLAGTAPTQHGAPVQEGGPR